MVFVVVLLCTMYYYSTELFNSFDKLASMSANNSFDLNTPDSYEQSKVSSFVNRALFMAAPFVASIYLP